MTGKHCPSCALNHAVFYRKYVIQLRKNVHESGYDVYCKQAIWCTWYVQGIAFVKCLDVFVRRAMSLSSNINMAASQSARALYLEYFINRYIETYTN